MELVSLGKEVLQNIAEQAVSYRLGQSVLRQLDRVLWVVEKCARWAVPPPLDLDERPQPELVRPLPWLLFLPLLILLRFTRESISLVNLVMGKPPLRSADVVMYVQSKRRYLRTLKYQGNRLMRARTGAAQPRTSEPWYSGLHSLFEFTMCFRRHSLNYGNNNTTSLTNNDEVMIVKRSKRDRSNSSPAASTSEATMERLIEKMMIDLDADSDEDSNYTLTNVTSNKSDRSEGTMESDQDSMYRNDMNSPNISTNTPTKCNGDDLDITLKDNEETSPKTGNGDVDIQNGSPNYSHIANSTPEKEIPKETPEDAALNQQNIPKISSLIEDTQNFLQHELPQKHRTPKSGKIANGRTIKSAPAKKKGAQERRDSDMPIERHVNANNSL